MNTNKIKNISNIILCGLVIFGFTLFAWLKGPTDYSSSERRTLAQMPKLTADTLTSGKFMSDFDDYSMDQFPLRDLFRRIKATAVKYVFQQKDSNGLYSVGGYVSKLEYPFNSARVDLNIKKLNEVYETLLKGTNIKLYLSLIPDKNCFLAPMGGYPTLDYEAFMKQVSESVPCDEYIDIADLLSLEDFYLTDQHWKQECVVDVAQRLVAAMNDGAELDVSSFEEKIIDYPFYGAYVGQAALPFKADTIHYLTNDVLESCRITSYNSGSPKPTSMYVLEKATGRDPYEMFLAGADPLLIIENPKAQSRKELVVFRDSFGSSLIPLLVPQYSKITILDLRYIRSSLIPNFVQFKNQDVLFLYSTLIFNNTISQ